MYSSLVTIIVVLSFVILSAIISLRAIYTQNQSESNGIHYSMPIGISIGLPFGAGCGVIFGMIFNQLPVLLFSGAGIGLGIGLL